MFRARTRLTRLFAVAIMASVAISSAIARAEPPPPSSPAGPVPVPYPNPDPPPVPECPYSLCPKAGAAQGGTAAHKHIGNVKYSDFAKSGEVSTAAMSDGTAPADAAAPAASTAAGDTQVIEAQSVSWDAGTVYSADPMEGGQVAAARTRPGRPTYGNLTAEPVMTAEPVARVAATLVTLAGKCVKGKHLNQVTITTRSGSFTLHDAIVTDVVPAENGMETVSLSYASKDD